MKVMPFVPALLVLALAGCGQQADEEAASQPESTPEAPSAAASPAEMAVPVALKSGEQVYKEVCQACHGAGIANAPKAGEPGGWAALFAEGQAVVTAHGWVGVRGMPAKGGRPDLSLEEFARATAWMARSAGGDWQDPDEAMLEVIREEEVKRIEELKARS
ncbi:MAG: c-type cytochrome [Thiobacillaceae bacterium]|jgi:cytochrome c5|nr:c-type cytochrome [Thiobacillaceae bacterium]